LGIRRLATGFKIFDIPEIPKSAVGDSIQGELVVQKNILLNRKNQEQPTPKFSPSIFKLTIIGH